LKDIACELVDAIQADKGEVLVKPISLNRSIQNEMLFFFKPECFLDNTRQQQLEIVNSAFNLFSQFGVQLSGVLVVAGSELSTKGIMDRHYGYINRVSRSAATLLEPTEIATIRTELGLPSSVPIFGGHEFLQKWPNFDAISLDRMWAMKRSRKLKSGLYFESYEVDGETVIVVNGFHPAQLLHFTGIDRRIALVVLHSELPWKFLRTAMLGDTFPDRAQVGSFRRMLYNDPKRFGLSQVSIAANAGHMSAGPFEGAYELRNFLLPSEVAQFDLESTRIWSLAKSIGLSDKEIQHSLDNPLALAGNREYRLFDLTEESDSLSAVHAFARFYCRQ
jgi:hypothetical protein